MVTSSLALRAMNCTDAALQTSFASNPVTDNTIKKQLGDSLSHTVPRVSTSCLPNITTCDQISQDFPSKAIKN